MKNISFVSDFQLIIHSTHDNYVKSPMKIRQGCMVVRQETTVLIHGCTMS